MALHDPDTELQYQAALDKLTREKAFMIRAAIKGGGKLNTQEMIEHMDVYLGDGQALAELLRRTAAGENALLALLNQIALEIGEMQAIRELADASRRRRQQALEDRAETICWQKSMDRLMARIGL